MFFYECKMKLVAELKIKKAAEAAFLLGTITLLESRFDYALKLKLRDNRAYVSVCQLN